VKSRREDRIFWIGVAVGMLAALAIAAPVFLWSINQLYEAGWRDGYSNRMKNRNPEEDEPRPLLTCGR